MCSVIDNNIPSVCRLFENLYEEWAFALSHSGSHLLTWRLGRGAFTSSLACQPRDRPSSLRSFIYPVVHKHEIKLLGFPLCPRNNVVSTLKNIVCHEQLTVVHRCYRCRCSTIFELRECVKGWPLPQLRTCIWSTMAWIVSLKTILRGTIFVIHEAKTKFGNWPIR